jgi:hypothetical protein
MATFALTGLGVLVVLQGDGAGAYVIGSVVIGVAVAVACVGVFFEVVAGTFAAPQQHARRR